MITQEQERLAKNVLNCAYVVHSFLGPGLLESTYQTCLQYELTQQGIFVECPGFLWDFYSIAMYSTL
jgi:GxxExxY protein